MSNIGQTNGECKFSSTKEYNLGKPVKLYGESYYKVFGDISRTVQGFRYRFSKSLILESLNLREVALDVKTGFLSNRTFPYLLIHQVRISVEEYYRDAFLALLFFSTTFMSFVISTYRICLTVPLATSSGSRSVNSQPTRRSPRRRASSSSTSSLGSGSSVTWSRDDVCGGS